MENCDHTQSMLRATRKVYGSVILGNFYLFIYFFFFFGGGGGGGVALIVI